MNLSICCVPQCVEPAQSPDFNQNKNSLEDMQEFPYLQQIENIAD